MASEEWLKKRYKMEAMVQHMSSNIAADPLPADPHAPVKVPKDQPGSSPWLPGKSPAPSRKGLASTQIKPNNIMLPFVPKDAETDEAYGEGNVPGHPDWSGVNQGTDVAGGPDYIGDKKTYGKLDRILNPLGDFKKPTLDQLKIHAANYPKA